MICKTCGKEVSSEFAFCPYCSGRVNDGETAPAPQKPVRKGKRALIIGIVLTVVLLLMSVAGWFVMRFVFFGAKDYHNVAMEYAAAEMTVDVETMNDNAVFRFDRVIETYLDNIEKLTGGFLTKEQILHRFGINENMLGVGSEFLLKYVSQEAEKTLGEKYGKYKVSTETLSSKKLSGEEIISSVEQSKKEAELLDKLVGSDVDLFSQFSDLGITEADLENGGYEIEVQVTINGEYDSDTFTKSYIVVKYKDEYKVLNMNIFTYNMEW